MRNFLAALTIMFCLAAPASAEEFEDGLAAYDKGDYITAFMIWVPAAVHGNAAAQFNLGVMSLEGKGTPPNPIQGLAWILMGVENMPDGENRKIAIELRDKVTAILTPDEIKKAEDMKAKWQKEHKEHLEGLKREAEAPSMQTPLEAAPLPGQLSMPELKPGIPPSEQPQIDFGKPAGKDVPQDTPPAEKK